MSSNEGRCWFNISLTTGLGPAAAQKIGPYLRSKQLSAESLVGLEPDLLRTEVGLSESVAQALADQLIDQVEPPGAEGAVMLTPDAEHFPNERFLNANPPLVPVLWAKGALSLLEYAGSTIAIAGSRETSEEILEIVYEVARLASRRGWLVVSGLAQGVDDVAHRGALAGGTGTVGVLASGLDAPSSRLTVYDPDEVCLISQFMPGEPWSGPRAMQRNATIASLADRVLVAAAGTSGGSWEMAQLCLKRKKHVFVLDLPEGEAPGNRRLIKAGAIGVDPADPAACLAPTGGPQTLFD